MPVVRIHRWLETDKKSETRTYVFVKAEGKFRLKTNLQEPAIKEQPVNDNQLRFVDRPDNIYRIVYFKQSQAEELLVLDVQPSKSTLELSDKRDKITIKAKVLSALTTSRRLDCESEIKSVVKKGQPVFNHEKFSLRGGGSFGGDLLPPDSSEIIDRLKLMVEVKEKDLRNSPSLNSELIKTATGLRIPAFKPPFCTVAGGLQVTKVSFPLFSSFIDPEQAGKKDFKDFHVLKFELSSGDSTKCVDSPDQLTFQTFWKDASIYGDFKKGESPAEWRFVQRPASSISTGPAISSASDVAPAPQWILHVYGVPTRVVARSWNKLASEYHLSLERIQGGNPVSFLPSFESFQPEPDKNIKETHGWWVMTYRLVDRASEDEDVIFEEDQVDLKNKIGIKALSLHFWKEVAADKAVLSGSLGQIKTTEGTTLGEAQYKLVNSFTPSSGGDDKLIELERLQGIVLKTKTIIPVVVTGNQRPVVRMGSLDLEFGTDKDAAEVSWLLIRPEGKLTGVHIDAFYRVSGIWPGGQDAPASEEFVPERVANFAAHELLELLPPQDKQEQCIDERFRLKQPIVIYDKPKTDTANRFLLRVREDVRPNESQAVRLEILSQTQAPPRRSIEVCSDKDVRIVRVLDRNPFLIAQVRYIPFDKVGYASNTVAIWSNAEGDGASWQLQFDEQPFCLVMPPQGIGEEMAKAKELGESKALDFNFSPAARLKLDPRAARTRFAEAPWNLRRILGTQGQPRSGPVVLHMQYELLYGLSCSAEKPAIRLADVFSRVGRIPARREQRIRWESTRAQRDAYQQERKNWSDIYRRYLSRVALLEPWNSILPDAEGNSVVLSEGLKCYIRLPPSSNMKAPFDPADGAPDGTLRGGATWGFESRNIYTAVIDSKNIESSSAKLSEFSLSSLGGWGKQEAGFQEDLTKIYGDVSMGRAYRYKLERIGRIAGFWNLAKHVIVYERTVVPSAQFSPFQNGLKGWPVLRKVREYVEILEDTRSYPDGDNADQEGAKRARGFVTSCMFQKGAQFNVLSAWGSDVRDFGWKVPLWNPGAEPASIYPKPKISLGLVSNLSEKEVIFPCDIAEPQNCYFYTQTKDPNSPTKNPDPDPHKWLPVEGVDYVNAPRPVVESKDFENGDPRQYEPREPDVPATYGPCTFRLDPSPVLTNLMAERAPKALSAVLETVTLVRSSARDAALSWKDAGAQHIKEVRDEITGVYKEFLSKLPLQEEPTDLLLQELRKLAATTDPFVKLKAKLTAANNEAKKIYDGLLNDVSKFEKDIRDRFKTVVDDLVTKPLDDFDQRVKELTAQFDQAKALPLLHGFQRAIEEKLLLLYSMPGAVLEFLARYVDIVPGLLARFERELKEIDDNLQSGASQAADAFRRANVLLSNARSLIKTFETIGQQRPVAWLPDPTPKVKEFLNPYFEKFEDESVKLLSNLQNATTVRAAQDAIRDFKLSPFYTTLRHPNKLGEFVKAAFGINAETLTFEQMQEAVHLGKKWQENVLKLWREETRKRISEFEASQTAAKLGAIRDNFKDWLTKPGQNLQEEIRQFGLNVEGRISSAVNNVMVDALKKVETDLGNLAGDLKKRLDGLADAKQLKKMLEAERDRLAHEASTYLDQAAQFLIKTENKIFQQADETLRVIRAFGAPPRVPKLEFEREQIGYYFKELFPQIDLTPVNAIVDQGAAALEKLKPIGIKLPTRQAIEQLIPAELRNFDLSTIFPNFAGLDLRNLFAGLKLPSMGGDNVKITHGLDAQTRRAFVRTDVDFMTSEVATLFTIGPLSLQVPVARFHATSIVEADTSGAVKRKVNGSITGDWQIVISSMVIIKFKNTELFFDDSNGIRFSINPRNIELPGILTFLAEAMKQAGGGDGDGLSIGLLPDGFQSVLSLPLPDVQSGAFGISNLRLVAVFSLRFGEEFTINLGCGVARKEAPFTLTIFILGGAGFFEVTATYTPAKKTISCEAEIGITAAASLAIALGPIKGGVYAYFGVTARYQTGGAGLTLGVMLLFRGNVSILSIAQACITQLLEATYNPANKTLVGRGRFSIKIKICWCFTLKVSKEITYTVGSSSGRSARSIIEGERNNQAERFSAEAAHASMLDEIDLYAKEYIRMLV